MAFVYNNKLPFHSWGVMAFGSLGKTHALYQLLADSGGLIVPTHESGAQKLWIWRTTNDVNSVSSSSPSGIEATPCDAQVPWRCFVFDSALPRIGYGLTLHGEIYAFESGSAAYGNAGINLSRRIERVVSANTQKPFSSLHFADSLLTTNYSYNAIATTSDGKCWWIRKSRTSAPIDGHSLEEIAVPSGTSAVAAWRKSSPDIVVLNTDEGKTYVKARTSSTWYCLTTGVYRNSGWNIYNHLWNTNDLPTVTVSAPPSGGVTATVTPTWQALVADPTYSWLDKLQITNPGSGYESDPSVIFSREPDAKTSTGAVGGAIVTPGVETSITMTRFADKITELLGQPNRQTSVNRWASSSGKVWSIRAVSTTNDVWVDDASSNYKDASGTVLSVKDISISGAYLLTTSGAVYKSDFGTYSLVHSGPFTSMAGADSVVAVVKDDGGLYTFGTNGNTARRNTYGALFGDTSQIGSSRSSPAQIAVDAEWVSVWSAIDGFVAIRKDAICRSIDQPMEYWPDWYFEQQTA